jgi:hypothetical protein
MTSMSTHVRRSAVALLLALAMPLLQAAPPANAAPGAHVADGVGYVSVIRLAHPADTAATGRLLMVFERPGRDGIPLYESRDDGDHWRYLRDVAGADAVAAGRDPLRWQPNLYELPRAAGGLPAGTLLLSANATARDAEGRITGEDLQVYASTDGGAHWRYRGSIIRGGGNPGDKDNKGVWEPDLHLLDDGALVAYYSTEQHKADGYNQALAHKVSRDGGVHWGPEVLDVAVRGGVERPGMAIVTRLPDGRYAMTYEAIDGPHNGQVFIRFSRDGLDWGDPELPGTPVATASGAWPAACPVVRWFPVGGPQGVLVISAERAGGGGDEAGHALYWNNAMGRGPWWEVPAPVQKNTGNIHAGWTQALLRRDDGRFLHVTSSSSLQAPEDADANTIVAASAALHFDRYEAEDAARAQAVAIGDTGASNGRKARLGAGPQAHLRFDVHVARAGTQTLRIRFADIGLPGVPGVVVNGAPQPPASVHDDGDGWQTATVQAPLLAGFNTIDLTGGVHALDIDSLQLGAATP